MLKPLTNLSLRMFATFFPTEKPLLLSGTGSSERLAELVRIYGCTRPLLVTEKTLIDLGLVQGFASRLQGQGCAVAVFDGVTPNPTNGVVEAALAICKERGCDSVIAIGGGSATDAAKVVAACAANGATVSKAVGIRKLRQAPLPFFVIPTTSGTGSEATNAAVISHPQTHEKQFVVDPRLGATAVALDAELQRSLPPHITAATGMDALTHAIEAFLSLNRFADAERDAKLAIRLLFEHLPLAYEDGGNLKSREFVALASFLAGYAFNKSGLGYVHAISHQISAQYNTPHGLANAILLPHVLRYNQEAAAPRLAELERALSGGAGGAESALAERFVARISALCAKLAIPESFEKLDRQDFPEIVTGALKEARFLYAVPRVMNAAQCERILAAVTAGNFVAAGLPNRPAISASTPAALALMVQTQPNSILPIKEKP